MQYCTASLVSNFSAYAMLNRSMLMGISVASKRLIIITMPPQPFYAVLERHSPHRAPPTAVNASLKLIA